MRVPPPLIALIHLALMWVTAHFLHLWRFSFPFQPFAAAAIALVGISFAVLSFRAFQSVGTTASPIRIEEASALVTTGTYGITRNPMYLGLLLMLTGWFVFLGEGVNAAFLVLFITIISVVQIAPEERVLRQTFGDAYIAYCRKVRRWL